MRCYGHTKILENDDIHKQEILKYQKNKSPHAKKLQIAI